MSLNIASPHQLPSFAQPEDADALAALINQSLFPLGVTVLAAIHQECLVLRALLPPHIDRLFLINCVREGMESLQLQSIKQVVLIGQDRENIRPDWQYILNLARINLPPVNLPPIPTRRQSGACSFPGVVMTSSVITTSSLSSVTRQNTEQKPLRLRVRRPRHPLAHRSICLLLMVAAGGLLIGGAWAAKSMFLVENHQNQGAPSSTLLVSPLKL
jgi:hypothetical protein